MNSSPTLPSNTDPAHDSLEGYATLHFVDGMSLFMLGVGLVAIVSLVSSWITLASL